MAADDFDRGAEDLGNIVNLGHVNHGVPDQGLATIFYIMGLGLTRDPALMIGVDNMWVNIGDSQFHLPTGPAVVAPGIVTGLVVPDLASLRVRLESVRSRLARTHFDIREVDGAIEVICPWGNRIRCHEPRSERFDPRGLGLAYVEFEVPRGRARAIARFYHETMRALTSVEANHEGERACIVVGCRQRLIFRECAESAPPCPDHHIQVYVADFSGPYQALKKLGVEVEESNRYQYRFESILDVDAGEPLYVLDHEVRSLTHPMYNRPLVNRNPAQTTAAYIAGGDFYAPDRR